MLRNCQSSLNENDLEELLNCKLEGQELHKLLCPWYYSWCCSQNYLDDVFNLINTSKANLTTIRALLKTALGEHEFLLTRFAQSKTRKDFTTHELHLIAYENIHLNGKMLGTLTVSLAPECSFDISHRVSAHDEIYLFTFQCMPKRKKNKRRSHTQHLFRCKWPYSSPASNY